MRCSSVACLAVSLYLPGIVIAQPGPQATNYLSERQEPAPGIYTRVESFHNATSRGVEKITYHFCNDSDKPIIFWWDDIRVGSTGAGGWAPGCGETSITATGFIPAKTTINYFAYGAKRNAQAFLSTATPSDKLDEQAHVATALDANLYAELQRINIRARVEVDFTFAKGETTLNVRWHEGIEAIAIAGLLDDPAVLDQIATKIRNDAAFQNAKILRTKDLPQTLPSPGVVSLDSLRIADKAFLLLKSKPFSSNGGGELHTKFKPSRAPRTIDSEPLFVYDEKLQLIFIIHYSVPK